VVGIVVFVAAGR